MASMVCKGFLLQLICPVGDILQLVGLIMMVIFGYLAALVMQQVVLAVILMIYGNIYSINNQWVWMTGASSTNAYGNYGTIVVAAAGNSPGARIGAVSWKDKTGNLWLFGGFGYAASGASGAFK